MENLYNILGISKNSTDDDIKKAYRDKAKEHHPDKGGDKEIFIKIQLAYEVLSDPLRRIKYDTEGTYDEHIYANIELKAIEYLVIMFDKALNDYIQIDINGFSSLMSRHVVNDIISKMSNDIKNELKNIKMNKNAATKVLESLEKLKKKIKYKKDDNRNILDKIMENKIRAVKKDLDMMDVKTETINITIEMLKDYKIEEEILLKLNCTYASTLETV